MVTIDEPLTSDEPGDAGPIRRDNPIYHFAVWVSANLSGDTGLARIERERLREFGISVGTVGGGLR